jgi:hypothetical protein
LRQFRQRPHGSTYPLMAAPPSPSPRCPPAGLQAVPATPPQRPSSRAKCTSNRHKHNPYVQNPLVPQWVYRVRPQIVALVAAGSSPVSHPK